MRRAVSFIIAALLIIGAAGCTVHTDSHGRDQAKQAAEEAKQEAREAAKEAKREGKEAAEEGKRAAEEARREANDARREARQQGDDARREADEARRDALAQADEARRQARQQGDDARRQTNEAHRDAADVRDDNDDEREHSRSGDVVNINTADAQQIADATGVTPSLAQKIVASRPYVSKRDLVSKKVVDDPTYWKIQKYVTVMSK
jgi:DNA uptake protein ComE-like DNA-binding protein